MWMICWPSSRCSRIGDMCGTQNEMTTHSSVGGYQNRATLETQTTYCDLYRWISSRFEPTYNEPKGRTLQVWWQDRKFLIQKRVIMCKCQNVNDLLARQAGILEYDECATQKMKWLPFCRKVWTKTVCLPLRSRFLTHSKFKLCAKCINCKTNVFIKFSKKLL